MQRLLCHPSVKTARGQIRFGPLPIACPPPTGDDFIKLALRRPEEEPVMLDIGPMLVAQLSAPIAVEWHTITLAAIDLALLKQKPIEIPAPFAQRPLPGESMV